MSHVRRSVLSLVLVPVVCLSFAGPAEGRQGPAAAAETIFAEDFSAGMDRWQAVHGGDLGEWEVVEDTDLRYATVDARTGDTGRYIVPTDDLDLPSEYELRTRVRLDATAASAKLTVLTDLEDAATDITSKNLAVQIPGSGQVIIASPVSKGVRCSGPAPFRAGEWHDLTVRRAADVSVVEIDGQQVAAVAAPDAGGTIALSAYRAQVSFASVSVTALDGVPVDHPSEPTGCDWREPGGPDVDQPVLLNQSGFDLGRPKRFTAPEAEDGAAFSVRDAGGTVRHEGTVTGQVGDFSEFDPDQPGPFTVEVVGDAGTGTSVPFGIGAHWIERVSYENAVEFMTGSRCYFGDLGAKADGPGLASDVNGHPDCIKAVTWRDGAHYSMEVSTLVDLYLSNPDALERIHVPDAVYDGLPVTLPDGTPEIVRLIHWGVELLLDADVNDPQFKEQLAAFLHAYPYLSEWIPRDVYQRTLDHLVPLWGDPARDRYYWQAYTPHTGDLFQVFTEVGTGKGELAPGHSVWPNVMMYEVALREGLADPDAYLDAARDQAAWLIDNLDLDAPETTKGQRQSEHVLITGLARFATAYPEAAPDGTADFVRAWADVVTQRSDNLWDFRRYSDDRWTIPSFTGGGSGEDPNETGNVAGFAAPALAAARLLDGEPVADRLREIAHAHVDNIFGRNPTGRHASYRAPTEEWGFEGVERGWFSEYQGGYGKLQGLVGVLDGSPKNGHYPFNPGTPNIGHTEGWVAFNSSWNASLAWLGTDSTTLALTGADGSPVDSVAADGTLTVRLEAPLNLDATAADTGTVDVRVGSVRVGAVDVVQDGPDTTSYTGTLDLGALEVEPGDVVDVSYGLGTFATSASVTVVPAMDADPTGVVPIDWDSFGAGLPDDEQAERSAAILLNANRYAMQTWYPAKYGDQTGEYLDLGGVGEGNIRPPGSEAIALATSLATGVYDADAVGVPEAAAREAAVKITTSIAYRHRANDPDGWGDAWQSALWAFNAGFAGWLLWDDLPADDQERLERMVVSEADRFLYYDVPYYQRPDGTVVTPGDSKAEENAWNAAFLNLAVAMLPNHPNVRVWQDKALELMVSAYARPADLTSDDVVNGTEVRDWLNGSNIFDDGTLVNHNLIHPDYATSIANSVGAPLAYGLAGRPTPEAALFNADVVYDALVDLEFSAPPYAAPGGTSYVRDDDGGATATIYYPQGNDWGTHRQMNFLLLDTMADLFGFDENASVAGAHWAREHASRVLEMQARFDDGRTYGAPSEDTYSGREEWVALLAGRTYLTHWLDHNGGVTFTDRAFPVRPHDYPGADVDVATARAYPIGVPTEVSVTVHSRSEARLTGLTAAVDVPDGWTVEPVAALPRVLAAGRTATATWRVTAPDGADPTARIATTVDYTHLGIDRSVSSHADVAVPPGVNVALGRPVEVSSANTATSTGDKAVDGLFTDASRWVSAVGDDAPRLTIDLGDPVEVGEVHVYSGYQRTNNDPTTTLKDFVVEVRTDAGWQEVASYTGNVEHRVAVTDVGVTGDGVRLRISDPSGNSIDVARVFEVEVYAGGTG